VCGLLEKKINNLVSGGWEHLGTKFLRGHAEWVETRDLMVGNFDSHLRIKVMALKVFPYVCIGSHAYLCNVCPYLEICPRLPACVYTSTMTQVVLGDQLTRYRPTSSRLT
jgi:hypothetical protein